MMSVLEDSTVCVVHNYMYICMCLYFRSEEFSVVAVGFTDGHLRCYSHVSSNIVYIHIYRMLIHSKMYYGVIY